MKKYIYIFSWIILGTLLSFIVHAAAEMAYINYSLLRGIVLANHTAFGYGYCVLPIYIQITLLILGILSGLLCGRFFWRIIYIEKKYQSKKYK